MEEPHFVPWDAGFLFVVARRRARQRPSRASPRCWTATKLDRDDDGAVSGEVAIGHAGGVEGEPRAAVAIEQDEPTAAADAVGEQAHAGFGGSLRQQGRSEQRPYSGAAEEVGGGLGHDDLHDGFAPARAGDPAGLHVSVAAAANQRRVAYAPRPLAASAAGRGACDQAALEIERHGTDGAKLVPEVELGLVTGSPDAAGPGRALAFGDQFLRPAERQAVLDGKLFGAGANQHHVLPRFEQLARQANGVADALDGSDSAGLKRCAVHEDGVEFDAAVPVQVRADAGVEDGVVFEYDDGCFNGVQRRAAALEYLPAGLERLPATGAAGLDRFVRNVPGAAVNDQRWFHGQRGFLRGCKLALKDEIEDEQHLAENDQRKAAQQEQGASTAPGTTRRACNAGRGARRSAPDFAGEAAMAAKLGSKD